MATSKNQAAEAAGQAATRMDELRNSKSPWGYSEIADAMAVDIETARRWAHDGRMARDEKIAKHYHVKLDTVRGWRKTGKWDAKADAVDLNGVGVGFHMLPEHTHMLGDIRGWDRDVIIAWGCTAFDDTGRTRLDRKTGEARHLVPTGRPKGIPETGPRPPRRPGRETERAAVIKDYVKRVKGGATDTQARGAISDEFGITRKQVSRYLVEGRANPEKYGEIPQGSSARGSRPADPPPAAPRRTRRGVSPERKYTTVATTRKSAGKKALTT